MLALLAADRSPTATRVYDARCARRADPDAQAMRAAPALMRESDHATALVSTQRKRDMMTAREARNAQRAMQEQHLFCAKTLKALWHAMLFSIILPPLLTMPRQRYHARAMMPLFDCSCRELEAFMPFTLSTFHSPTPYFHILLIATFRRRH